MHGVDNDLWGWSCSTEATALQSDVVNFSYLCSVQSRSWDVSIAEIVGKIVFAVGQFFVYRRTRDDEKHHLANGVGGAEADI